MALGALAPHPTGDRGQGSWWVRMERMTASTSAPGEVQIDCVLFREYFIGQFSIGGDGPWERVGTPLVHVKVVLAQVKLVVEVVNSNGTKPAIPWGTGGTWDYHEVARAQVLESTA